MPSTSIAAAARPGPYAHLMRYLPLLGVAAIALPTLLRLSAQAWNTDLGAHGPIVLATGAWLIWHVRDELVARGGRPLPFVAVAPLALLAAALYAFGRAYDFLAIEAGALYAMTLLIAARFIGVRGIVRNLFPFLYLIFLVPPPGWMIDQLTGPLREMISVVATQLLDIAGYPVAREGVVISIGAYQLLVEDACSGLNSLVGLTAISIFYIYLVHRADWRHAALLLMAVIPIAMLANLIRVLALILITYYLGDAAAQGFLHNFAGIMLFALALAMMVGTNWLIQRLFARRAPIAAATA